MIRLLLSGGLGNQLFEYATGRAIGIRTGTSLEIDLRFYNDSMTGTSKAAWISDLPVNATFKRYKTARLSAHNPIKRGFEKIFLERFREVYIDTELGFKDRVLHLGSNSTLVGYFQCYKYFVHHWHTISRELDMSPFADQNWLNEQQSLGLPWCAVHIRRGDYVGDTRYEMQSPDIYYSRAMQVVREARPNTRFVIFSDGIDWCRGQSWLAGCEFYEKEGPRHPAADLATMAGASSNIIANSSYSWWAAWTGQRKGKFIVAPSVWVEGQSTIDLQMVPDDWIVV